VADCLRQIPGGSCSEGESSPAQHRRFVVFSGLANIVWLFLWHYEVFNFSLVAMMAILLSLIAIYLRLHVGRVLPAVACWAGSGFHRGEMVCSYTHQYLSGLDYGGYNRQRHPVLILSRLEKLRDQPGGLGGDHAGGWRHHLCCYEPEAR